MEIEFSDRYGGRTPSTLTSCHECEAMGCYPSADPTEWPAGSEPDEIGYVFVVCSECKGTARVSKFQAIKRIPAWLLKGVRFIWDTRNFAGPNETLSKRIFMSFKCAFMADLGLWSPYNGGRWLNPFTRHQARTNG